MAKPVKRNRQPIEKIDYIETLDGVYIDDVAFGELHLMKVEKAKASYVDEFVYEGKLHNGEIKFLGGSTLVQMPSMAGFNHGYTLEGDAQYIFEVENALDVYSSNEKRTFNYTQASSKLKFIGDSSKEYVLYVRFYENCYGNLNNRWAVIYAEEK